MKKIIFFLLVCVALGCQNQNELADGWYIETEDGLKMHLAKTPDDCCNHSIEAKPFVDFKDIEKLEINRDARLDESIEVFFHLNANGTAKFNKVLTKNYGEEIFLVLDNQLTNFTRIDSGYYRYGELSMTLGYSDYSSEEVERIIERINKKLSTTKPKLH